VATTSLPKRFHLKTSKEHIIFFHKIHFHPQSSSQLFASISNADTGRSCRHTGSSSPLFMKGSIVSAQYHEKEEGTIKGDSSKQVEEHPSPSMVFPSSQYS